MKSAMKNTNIMADTNSTTGHKSDNECGKYTSLAMENCWAVKATKTVKYLGVLIEGRRRVFCSETKPDGLKRGFICCCGVHMFEYDNVETARLFTSKLDNMKSSMALAIDLVNKGHWGSNLGPLASEARPSPSELYMQLPSGPLLVPPLSNSRGVLQ